VITVSPSMQAILSNSNGLTPVIDVSLPLNTSGIASLSSQSQMLGLNDVAAVSDVNVDAARQAGQLTLAAGSYHAAQTATAPFPLSSSVTYEISVIAKATYDIISLDGISIAPTPGFYRTVKKTGLDIIIPFTARLTGVIDEISIGLSMSGNAATGKLKISILDALDNVVSMEINVSSIVSKVTSKTVTGLSAKIVNGAGYKLKVSAVPPDKTLLAGPAAYAPAIIYAQTLTVSRTIIANGIWDINTDAAGVGFHIGGRGGYQATGSAYRSLDAGSVPTQQGTIEITAVDSASYPLVIDAYYTADAALFTSSSVVGWTKIAAITSGMTVPPSRYWRFHIQLTANASLDVAPILDAIKLMFFGKPMVLSNMPVAASDSAPVLHNIGSLASQLTNKANSVFQGRINAQVAYESRSLPLLDNNIVGNPVTISLGFSQHPDRIEVFKGSVEDIRYDTKTITLMMADNIRLADVTIPKKDSFKGWDKAQYYATGDYVTYKFFTYKSLTNHINIAPTVSATDWQQITFPKIYSAATNAGLEWHLVDIALDILRNEINIPDTRINMQSFVDLKASRMGYTGSRSIVKPEKALGLLGELAWLLECQWIESSYGIALIPEATLGSSTGIIPSISDNDIAMGSFSYRRGWKEMVNECLIFSQWDGVNYQSATAYADANSIASHHVTQQEVGYDKWSMPQATLDMIARNLTARKRTARRIISLSASIKHLRLEGGDRVQLSSSLLPASDPLTLDMVVVRKDITSWKNQTIKLTLMEIL